MFLWLACSWQRAAPSRQSEDVTLSRPYEPDADCVKQHEDSPFWIDGECRGCAYVSERLPVWTGSECVSCADWNPDAPYWDGRQCVSRGEGDDAV